MQRVHVRSLSLADLSVTHETAWVSGHLVTTKLVFHVISNLDACSTQEIFF